MDRWGARTRRNGKRVRFLIFLSRPVCLRGWRPVSRILENGNFASFLRLRWGMQDFVTPFIMILTGVFTRHALIDNGGDWRRSYYLWLRFGLVGRSRRRNWSENRHSGIRVAIWVGPGSIEIDELRRG